MRAPGPEDLTSPLHGPAVASRVGIALAVCFGTCFLTGLVSHYAQNPTQPVPFPTSPAWGYRVTQGLHVVTGTVAVPLLLVKLWTVYPRLLDRLPHRDARRLVLALLGRLSVAVLVASAVFMLATGLANSAQWYPWDFSFRTTHYALAWVAIGALVVHVAVQLPVVRRELGTPLEAGEPTRPSVLSRRGLLRTTWLAGGVAAVATAGSTVPLLREVSVLGVRSGDGPQGVPVNTSAVAADVVGAATAPAWSLTISYGDTRMRLSRADLLALDQRTERLPIACVEGWSASGEWSGVRLRDLLDRVGAPRGSDVDVISLQQAGAFRRTLLQGGFADDDRTLVALRLDGEALALDHGFPARLIAPNRPGVLQTKWLDRLEVRT